MDFSNFKKNRKKLEKAVSKMKADTNSYEDTRFWSPKQDKAGNAEAIIRFLPQKDIEKAPAVKIFNHFFKERGQWFIEKCPTTIGKECPVCDYVKPLWDEDEDLARKYCRSTQYIANILVVKDPSNPENEGKVMLFRYGKKIQDKIMDKVAPESDLDEPVQIYDLWNGCNFKFKLKKVSGFNNYDSSEFYGKETAIADTDEEIEEIYNQIYDLDEFTDEKEFKKYEVIEKKFLTVIGKKQKANQEVVDDAFEDSSTGDNVPFEEETEVVSDDVEEFDDDFDFDFDDD